MLHGISLGVVWDSARVSGDFARILYMHLLEPVERKKEEKKKGRRESRDPTSATQKKPLLALGCTVVGGTTRRSSPRVSVTNFTIIEARDVLVNSGRV